MLNKQQIKAEIKKEIIQELEKERTVVKGDGYHFYNEQILIGSDGYYIHHSTLDCPVIYGGVKRDFTYTNAEHRNLFCSKCMDDDLINKFNNQFFSKNKNKNKNN